MNFRLLGVALLASVSLSLGSGCTLGCDPPNSQDHPPVALKASSVEAVRNPASCGPGDATFTDGDSFSLVVTGQTNVPPPYSTLTLVVTRAIPLNQAFPLNMGESP